MLSKTHKYNSFYVTRIKLKVMLEVFRYATNYAIIIAKNMEAYSRRRRDSLMISLEDEISDLLLRLVRKERSQSGLVIFN